MSAEYGSEIPIHTGHTILTGRSRTRLTRKKYGITTGNSSQD